MKLEEEDLQVVGKKLPKLACSHVYPPHMAAPSAHLLSACVNIHL